MNINNNLTSNNQPVYRGCYSPQGCFCTGRCKEVVGNIIDGKYVPLQTEEKDKLKELYKKNLICSHEQMIQADIESGMTEQEAKNRPHYLVCNCEKCTKQRPSF